VAASLLSQHSPHSAYRALNTVRELAADKRPGVRPLGFSLGVGGDGVFLSPSGGHGDVSLSLSLLILEIVDCCFVYSLLLSLLVAVARKYKPTQEDVELYQQFVDAAVEGEGHVNLGLNITLIIQQILEVEAATTL